MSNIEHMNSFPQFRVHYTAYMIGLNSVYHTSNCSVGTDYENALELDAFTMLLKNAKMHFNANINAHQKKKKLFRLQMTLSL